MVFQTIHSMLANSAKINWPSISNEIQAKSELLGTISPAISCEINKIGNNKNILLYTFFDLALWWEKNIVTNNNGTTKYYLEKSHGPTDIVFEYYNNYFPIEVKYITHPFSSNFVQNLNRNNSSFKIHSGRFWGNRKGYNCGNGFCEGQLFTDILKSIRVLKEDKIFWAATIHIFQNFNQLLDAKKDVYDHLFRHDGYIKIYHQKSTSNIWYEIKWDYSNQTITLTHPNELNGIELKFNSYIISNIYFMEFIKEI